MAIEDDDADRLDLGRSIPRAWFASGEAATLNRASTRWGRVDYTTRFDRAGRRATATITFAARGPREAQVRFRLPEGARPESARVNGRRARLDGDMVVIDARAAA